MSHVTHRREEEQEYLEVILFVYRDLGMEDVFHHYKIDLRVLALPHGVHAVEASQQSVRVVAYILHR